MILQMNGIQKSFGDLEVLKDISLHVASGEVVSVIGPSGSGKSTLLRCATFLESIDSGDISYMGKSAVTTNEHGEAAYVSHAELNQIKRYFGLVFQQFNLFPHMTVMENLLEAPIHVKGLKREEIEPYARELLAKVGLSDRADYYPSQLSGGQQQRVAIARAIASCPPLILADEPTGNLDSASAQEIMHILQTLNRDGRTVILITHDNHIAAQAHRTLRIADGKLMQA